MTKIINIAMIATTSLLFTACTSSSLPVPVETASFKAGSQDGCATANGAYTKNSTSFNNDQEYKNGWFNGRKKCNPAQAT